MKTIVIRFIFLGCHGVTLIFFEVLLKSLGIMPSACKNDIIHILNTKVQGIPEKTGLCKLCELSVPYSIGIKDYMQSALIRICEKL